MNPERAESSERGLDKTGPSRHHGRVSGLHPPEPCPETGRIYAASCAEHDGGARDSDQVREPRESGHRLPFCERHLQSIWYDPALRPASLMTHQGERLEVEDPGTWNLEAGPDFVGAVVRVGPERRRWCGDVEIHIRAQGWRQHGHHLDARYRAVRVHVTYFPGLVPEEELPPGSLQVSLQTALHQDPRFSFQAIDLAAYPYAIRTRRPPCSRILDGWDRDRRRSLLLAAGEERLRRKGRLLRERIESQGFEQTLYEEIFSALGYKHNKGSARRLAELLPLVELTQRAEGNADRAYALLAGLSGLLPSQAQATWSPEARTAVRQWWGTWWKAREELEPRTRRLPPWHRSGQRPANRPQRRLMAAATLFTRAPSLASCWEDALTREPEEALAAAASALRGLTHPFWSHHLGWSAERTPAPVALLGEPRIRGIIANVFGPLLANRHPDGPPGVAAALPTGESNRIVHETAQLLFGPDHAPALYGREILRQGLLQVFEDYCLVDRSRCLTCPLPETLAAHSPNP